MQLTYPVPTVTIVPWSPECLGVPLGTTAPASGTWSATNRAVLLPFRIYKPITAYSMFLVNGATGTFLFDLGIYDQSGRLLVATTGTAQNSNNAVQETSFASPLRIGAGLFYMGLGMSSNTATVFRRTIGNEIMNAMGCYILSTAYPLPATATFLTVPSGTNLPIFGVRTYA